MNNASEIMTVFVCEQTTEPQKMKINYISDKPGLKFVRFGATLQTYNEWNRNNRKYMLEPMKKTWNAPHIREMIRTGTWLGECGHPISEDAKRIVTIDPKVCSHRIIDFEFRGNSVHGTIETLNDAGSYGTQFMHELMQGVMGAFSIRALVPLTKVDAVRCEVRSPGHLITADRVILPSHKAAYQDTTGTPEMFVSSTESTMIPPGNGSKDLTVAVESSFLDYVMEESVNLKTIINNFEVDYESCILNPKDKTVLLREAADETGFKRTAIVKVEDHLKREISSMLADLY